AVTRGRVGSRQPPFSNDSPPWRHGGLSAFNRFADEETIGYIGSGNKNMVPLFLSAGIATCILIVIHFFGLRIRQKLEFTHIHFLSNLVSKTKSVKQAQNLLLLFFRTLFILSALLAFFLFFRNLQKSNSGITQQANVLVDSSWSMQRSVKANGNSLRGQIKLDVAKSRINQNTGNQNSSVKENETDVTLSSGRSLLQALEKVNPVTTNFFFSDFAKASFPKELLAGLPKNQNISLVPYSSNQANFFIDSVWLEQPVILPEVSTNLIVRLKGSQQTEKELIKITATEGEKLIGAVQVLVEPSEVVVTKLALLPSQDRETKVIIQLSDSYTPFDNKHFVVIPKASAIKVGVNGPIPDKHPVLRSLKEEAAFSFTTSQLAQPTFFIVDMQYAGNNAMLISKIKDVLKARGSVLLLPSASDQKPLLNIVNSLGLKNIKEEDIRGELKLIKAPDLSDGFFKGIFEKQVNNMKMPSATPVISWGSAFHTILRFTDNTPFLSSFKVGEGQVYVLSSPLDASSPFANHPLFVPVIYQLALAGQHSEGLLSYRPLNGEVNIPLSITGGQDRPFSLSMNGQTFIPSQLFKQGVLQLTLPDEVYQPGFYEIKNGEEVIQQIALNIPKEESLLESYSVEELRELFADTHPNVRVLESNVRGPVQKQEGITSLWKYCLILCLLCLIAEAIILSTKRREIPV
ncbi:BatA domain-containing protein, partial [Rufibacter sp. LB8]